jgi:hypothetical protein
MVTRPVTTAVGELADEEITLRSGTSTARSAVRR